MAWEVKRGEEFYILFSCFVFFFFLASAPPVNFIYIYLCLYIFWLFNSEHAFRLPCSKNGMEIQRKEKEKKNQEKEGSYEIVKKKKIHIKNYLFPTYMHPHIAYIASNISCFPSFPLNHSLPSLESASNDPLLNGS